MLVSISHLEPAPLRARLDNYLRGRGIELGPGHVPYPMPAGADAQLVDQWSSDENRVLFYELPPDVAFPKPDIIANLDVDRLSAIPDDSQDFVVASHILEHLAEPLGMLLEMHRVLRPGAVLLLLLPDRRRTFDRTRYGTSLEHVIREFDQGVTVVDDDHILDFLVQADHLVRRQEGVEPEPITTELIDAHRMRSIHAHCWTEDEFLDVLLYLDRHDLAGFDLVDGISSRAGRGSWEFGFVLCKAGERRAGDRSDEILSAWQAVVTRQELDDRWPMGQVMAQVLSTVAPVNATQAAVLHDVVDLVLRRADLHAAFAPDELHLDAAVEWAAGVADGTTHDSSAPKLRAHAHELADRHDWLRPDPT